VERPLPALPDAGMACRRARTGMHLLVSLLVLPFAVGGCLGTRGNRRLREDADILKRDTLDSSRQGNTLG
jgi:hypothetical protein